MAHRGPSSAFESETFGQDASFRLEQPVGALSISPSGRDVVLASKEGLHIIDLDSPYAPPRYLPHRTPWEVADVQWSPFASRDHWIISTSNQKALVWNLRSRSWQDSIEYVLHGHTRAITDINFSAHNPDVLATCAVDSFVHCWDLRTAQRPVNSFSDWFAGATQVKWSRQNEHVVASSHDKFLHIWDDRHGARPVRTIQAHDTKIYGIDWNRHQSGKILTCSLDRTIKFWDLDKSDDLPERVIETPFPVWRARHTPFGWGLLAMPQRGNSSLHLYDRRTVNGVYENGPVKPVTTFPGHDGPVKEFLWRARGDINNGIDHRDFQLVTWGTDRELRLHAVDPDVYLNIGYEKGVSKVQRLHFTRRGAVYRTFRDEPNETDSPVDPPARGELFPRQSMVQFRARTSTNIGMNKAPVSQFRGWVAGGRQAQRSGMHGRGHNRQTTDPIAWLKNVKVFSWDPDAIAEEIRQVGEKFKKVEFELLDIAHRKAIMSLQAPWGDNQSQVYLKVEMRFPKLYPRDANAVLSLQKTGSVDETTHKHISTELQTISETYASRRRGCLEAVMRYLLREQNLEQIVAWVLGESITDSKLLEPSTIAADESSSDEDDQIGGVRKRLDTSANLRVPFAKGCGALWSDTGKLVCFFPTKSKEPVSLLSTLGVKDLGETESNRLFEGFGRLHTSSPAPKGRTGTRTVDDDTASDTSESSWKSSSSSSASFETEQHDRGGSLPIPASGIHKHSRSPDRSNQSTTGVQKLNEAPQTSSISIHNLDDLVPSKRDLAEQYKIFGCGQEVCKHNAEVARRASLDDLESIWKLIGLLLDDSVPLEVLKEIDHADVGDVALIAKMTMRRPGKGKRSIDAGVKGRTRWGNHPFGSQYLIPAFFEHFERLGDVQMLAMMSCVFASIMDPSSTLKEASIIQSNTKGIVDSLPRSIYFPSRAVAKAFFQPNKTPEGFVLIDQENLFHKPNLDVVATGQTIPTQQRLQLGNRHGLGRQNSRLSSRAHSFVADDFSDHMAAQTNNISVSTSPEGNRSNHRSTASIAYSTARASLSALTQSYSNSPPSHNTASAIASSIKKYSPSGSLAPNWVSQGIFGSQTTNRQMRSSFHSAEATHQDYRDTGARSSVSSFNLRHGGPRSEPGRRSIRSIVASDISDETQKKPPAKRKKMKMLLFNQDKFDLDGYPTSMLMEPALLSKCRLYRACYAHLLDVWQLHIQRIEILKVDNLEADQPFSKQQQLSAIPTNSRIQTNNPFMTRPRRQAAPSLSRSHSPGLEIRNCCRRCGEPRVSVEKNGVHIGWGCRNSDCTAGISTRAPQNSACVICYSSIKGLSVPCLNCGHMTCFECAQGWFGKDYVKRQPPDSRRPSDETSPSTPTEDVSVDMSLDFANGQTTETQSCPTGCGCPCATLSVISPPFPLIAEAVEVSPPTSLTRQYSNSNNSTLGRSPSFFSANRSFVDDSTSEVQVESHGASDAALAAFLALTQSHQRQRSVTKMNTNGTHSSATTGHSSRGSRSKAPSISAHNATVPSATILEAEEVIIGPDDSEGFGSAQTSFNGLESEDVKLNPWAGGKIATLGRGIGAGLSRGLSSKGSNATIRKAK